MKKILLLILTIISISLLTSITVCADVQITDINSGWYWPVHSSVTTLTSPFGGWRNNFTNLHQGIDISGGNDLSIYASRYGDVAFKGYDSSMGYYVSLYHGEYNGYKIYSTYMHLAESAYVSEGSTVQGGQVIGKMGNTGSSDGTHLHFQITKSTEYVSSAYMPHKSDSQLDANFINTNPPQSLIKEWGLTVWNLDRFNNSSHPSCKYGTIQYTKVGEPSTPPDTEAPTYPGDPIKYVVSNTHDASNVTATSAVFNGTFTNPAGAKIVKRGYQWGTTPEMSNYTVFDCDITWTDGLTHNMMGLSPNTTYYYKLIVKGESGDYIYGNTKSFTTLSSGIEKVICNTGDAYNITATSAVFNGTFTNPAGARIVKRGFQWGTSPEMCNYTVFDCDITWVDGLNHNMVNLAPNTTYYYKLIVKGEDGDYIYGNTKSFTTLPVPDTDNPIITNLMPRYISKDSFTIKCNLYDNNNVTRVWLVIYSPNGEHQFGVSASNGDFSYTINTSDFGGSGNYLVHMYAFDAHDNSSSMVSTNHFLVEDDTVAPKLSNLSVTNVGDQVFEINCHLWDNVDVTRLWMVIYCPKGEYQFEIPAKQGNFTYPIDTDVYGGLGEYVIHIYAFDDAENSSGMVSTGSIIPRYYIGYDANGGNGAPDTQVKNYGESLIIDSKQPVRTGYIFKGWSDDLTTNPSFYPGTIFSNNYDLMLYACWEPAKYTITFESNTSEIQPTSKTVVYDSEYGTLPALHKDGYIFLGWFTDLTGGNLIASSTKVSITENQTLYAHWEKPVLYTESIIVKKGSNYYINIVPININNSCEIIVTGYKMGKFVTFTSSSYTLEEINTILSGDIDEIKVMVWDSLSGLTPLCEAEIIPSSEFIVE